ncbi:hypothetical protein [Sphingorhabdus sp.]|uniref:hypothetical protein n=1 Tax=Sphingorhabdus sp. TaxID=1902408 RepID=UPI0037CB397B
MAKTQMIESTPNAIIFLARRSRFDTAESAAMNLPDIFLEFKRRLSGMYSLTVRLQIVLTIIIRCNEAVKSIFLLFNSATTTSKSKN